MNHSDDGVIDAKNIATASAEDTLISQPTGSLDATENVNTCQVDGETTIRGQKRPLEETSLHDDDDYVVSTDNPATETNTTEYSLPLGVKVEWNDGTAVVRFDVDQENDARLCLVGRAKLKCLEGSIEILGHSLTPPICDNDNNNSHDDGVVVTSPYWSSWMTIFVKKETTAILQATSICAGSPTTTSSFRLVAPTRPIVIPICWKTTADRICQEFSNRPKPTRDSLEANCTFHHAKHHVLICGAKGVGKSTFLRYLTNRLLSTPNNNKAISQQQKLTHVAILDADVGQPELAPPGVLSLSLQKTPLLQPPYWNLTRPIETIASIFFGAVTSKVDPNRYVEGIQKLFQLFQEYQSHNRLETIPLLINMDGWVKGMGYEVLAALISSMQPTHVCQILGDTRGKQFELNDLISKDDTMNLFFLDACTNHITQCTIPSATLRTLRLATYFGPHLVELWDTLDFLSAKQLQTGWVDEDCTLAHYLARERPYCVPFETVQYMFIGADRQDLIHKNQVLQALNGSFVALCTLDDLCVGLGIVRSIDYRRELFYILTPVSDTVLPFVTKLVGGNLPLPLPFVFRGVHAESFPYLSTTLDNNAGTTDSNSSSKSALGSEPMKSRNNIGRKVAIAYNP